MLMKNKVCVVTGTASRRGIGRATADLLAAHGANLVLLDVSEDVTPAAQSVAADHPESSVLGVRCDVTSRQACEAAAAEVSRRFGRVDALVHCAGIMRPGRYDEISDDQFHEMMAVNLTGTFNIIRVFAALMAAQGSGSIVAVASVAAQRGGGLFGGAHYAASKGGVLSLVKTLARELGSVGVRVNAVCPSLIETDFVAGAVSAERVQQISATIPLGRPGRPEEVAGANFFLASDLSSYITGSTIDVNGGFHIH